jgi:hypothetical protein
MTFTRNHEGRTARVGDLNSETIQAWMDEMAARVSLSSIASAMSR